jgi:hypothetical protein
MTYQYIISILFVIVIFRIIYILVKSKKQGSLTTENIIVSLLMILFFVYMIYERLTK